MPLTPNDNIDAASLVLSHKELPASAVVDGQPTTGWARLGENFGREIGVWEITEGTATDVEVDEVFVVIAGRGRIEFSEPALAPIDLAPGRVVKLKAGAHTRWIVAETLRKFVIL